MHVLPSLSFNYVYDYVEIEPLEMKNLTEVLYLLKSLANMKRGGSPLVNYLLG